MNQKIAPQQHKTPDVMDWLVFALIVIFGGSSFAMIEGAIDSIPATVIAQGRLWIATLVLYIMMRTRGRHLPPLLVKTSSGFRVRRSWKWMIAIGLIGNVLPFFIFPWAQQYVDSGLAGIYMAFMPIWTVGLAYFFAGESLTRQKLIGLALGVSGIVVLMGPDALKGLGSTNILAQLAILSATVLYATSAVIARRAPPIRPRVFTTGILLSSAVASLPVLFFFDLEVEHWTFAGIANVIGLGVFPTGIGGILIIILIRRVGAGFFSLVNYVTPLWAVALGALIYGERLAATSFAALGIILLGVAISQRGPGATKVTETSDGLAGEIAPMVDKVDRTER